MKEPEDTLQPETIDRVIEGGALSRQDHQTGRLIQQLHEYTQEYARENEHSLDRIWSRIAHSQEHVVFLPEQWKQHEEKKIYIEEIKAMKTTQDQNETWDMGNMGDMGDQGGMKPPASHIPLHAPESETLAPRGALVHVDGHHSRKRGSLRRITGVSLIAAVAIIAVVSFAFFSGMLRPGMTTITGAKPHLPARITSISGAKQVCSVSIANDDAGMNPSNIALTDPTIAWRVQVGWSAQGEVSALSFGHLRAFSTKDCGVSFAKSILTPFASWSPDGKKLAIVTFGNAGGEDLVILDSNGNLVETLTLTKSGADNLGGVASIAWSADSSTLTFVLNGGFSSASGPQNLQTHVKSVSVSNIKNVTNLLTLPGVGKTLSPDGKLLVKPVWGKAGGKTTLDMQIWDVNSGKKVSDITSIAPSEISNWAFSPDDSMLALNETTGQTVIYSTESGKQLASFASTRQPNFGMAWSPDSRYLAESGNAIQIYDVKAQKVVTTFGSVDARHSIQELAWSPDGTGLVSSSAPTIRANAGPATVTVWQFH